MKKKYSILIILLILLSITIGFYKTETAQASQSNGPKIAFTSERDGNFEIYVMNADGSDPIRLTYDPAEDYLPDWSPDGKKIAFHSDRDGGNPEIYVMNADGSDPIRLTTASGGEPDWSPDGKKIAFTGPENGRGEIWVMNADGSDPIRLTYNPAYDWSPAWSPDGKRIAFASDRDGDWEIGEIYVMNADGSEQTRLTYNTVDEQYPTWSPDGKKIAYQKRDGYYDYEIYVMNADGSEQTNLTNNETSDGLADWSPDGKKIAFGSERDDNQEIYVMNANGSDPIRLTYNPAYDWYPAWSPIQVAQGSHKVRNKWDLIGTFVSKRPWGSIVPVGSTWNYEVHIKEAMDGEKSVGVVKFMSGDVEVIGHVKATKTDYAYWHYPYDPFDTWENLAAVGQAEYSGTKYNFMFLYSEGAIWIALSNEPYDIEWSEEDVWSGSLRAYDLLSQIITDEYPFDEKAIHE